MWQLGSAAVQGGWGMARPVASSPPHSSPAAEPPRTALRRTAPHHHCTSAIRVPASQPTSGRLERGRGGGVEVLWAARVGVASGQLQPPPTAASIPAPAPSLSAPPVSSSLPSPNPAQLSSAHDTRCCISVAFGSALHFCHCGCDSLGLSTSQPCSRAGQLPGGQACGVKVRVPGEWLRGGPLCCDRTPLFRDRKSVV